MGALVLRFFGGSASDSSRIDSRAELRRAPVSCRRAVAACCCVAVCFPVCLVLRYGSLAALGVQVDAPQLASPLGRALAVRLRRQVSSHPFSLCRAAATCAAPPQVCPWACRPDCAPRLPPLWQAAVPATPAPASWGGRGPDKAALAACAALTSAAGPSAALARRLVAAAAGDRADMAADAAPFAGRPWPRRRRPVHPVTVGQLARVIFVAAYPIRLLRVHLLELAIESTARS